MKGKEEKRGLSHSTIVFDYCYILLEYPAGALRRREVLAPES